MRDRSKEFYSLLTTKQSPIEKIRAALAYAEKLETEAKLDQLTMDYVHTPDGAEKPSALSIFGLIDTADDDAESVESIALLELALKCKIVLNATNDSTTKLGVSYSHLFHNDFMNIIKKGRWKTALLIAQSLLAFKSEFKKTQASASHIAKLVGEVLATPRLIDSYPGEESNGYLPRQLVDTLNSIFGTHYIYKGTDSAHPTYASHIALGRNPSDSNGYYKMLTRITGIPVTTQEANYVYLVVSEKASSPLETLIARRSWSAIAAVTTAEYFPANVRGDSRFETFFTKIFLKLTEALKTETEAPFRDDILKAIENLINQGLFTPEIHSECFFVLKDPTVFGYLMEKNTEKMILDNLVRVSGVDMSLVQYRDFDESLRKVLFDKKYKASCLLAGKGKADELMRAVYANPELLTVTQGGLTPFEIALASNNILVAQKILALVLAKPEWLNLKTEETPPRMLSAVIMNAMATHILKNKKLDERLSSIRGLTDAIYSNSLTYSESFGACKVDILKIALFIGDRGLVEALMPHCITAIFDAEQTDVKTHQRTAITDYLLSPESFELFSRNYLTQFAALSPEEREKQIIKLEAYLAREQKENPEKSLFPLFNFLGALGESSLINDERLMRLFAAGLKGLRHSYVNFESTAVWHNLIANKPENLNPYFYLLEYVFEKTKTDAECKAIFEKILLLDKAPDESSFLAHLLKIGDTDYLSRYFRLLEGIGAKPADFQAAFAYKAPVIAGADAALNPIDVLATQALAHPELLDLCIPYLSLESIDILIIHLTSAEMSKTKGATLAKLALAREQQSHRDTTQLGIKTAAALEQIKLSISKLENQEVYFAETLKKPRLVENQKILADSASTMLTALSQAVTELTLVNTSLGIIEDETGVASSATDLSPGLKIDETLAEIDRLLKQAQDRIFEINEEIKSTSIRLCESLVKRTQLRRELKTAITTSELSAAQAKLLAAETEVEALRKELSNLESRRKEGLIDLRPIYAQALSFINNLSKELTAQYEAVLQNIENRLESERTAEVKLANTASPAVSADPATTAITTLPAPAAPAKPAPSPTTTAWGLFSFWDRASSVGSTVAAVAGAGAGTATTPPAIIGSLNG